MSKSSFNSKVRTALLQVIDDHVARKSEYVENPERNFTRNRKLTLSNVLKATLLLGSGSIDKELLEYFNYDSNTVTGSAFTQQRDKLSSSIFKSIFEQFTRHFDHYKSFMRHRIVSCAKIHLKV